VARLTLIARALAATLLAAAGPAAAQGVAAWESHIAEASARFGVPAGWIRRVMDVESGGRAVYRGRPVRSRAGAMGLMQLMPGTWQAMRRAHGLGPDPDDPRDNILAGTAYLRAMYDRFGYPGLFAAYNAGPARYAEHLSRARPLPAETRAYLAKVAGATGREGSVTPSGIEPGVAGLFAVRPSLPAADDARLPPPAARPGVFFALPGSSPP
jgi:soluble lytic murein transglycosylase-like protein